MYNNIYTPERNDPPEEEKEVEEESGSRQKVLVIRHGLPGREKNWMKDRTTKETLARCKAYL